MIKPLLLSDIITHASRHHSLQKVVTYSSDGNRSEVSYSDIHKKSKQFAQYLNKNKIIKEDVIGTIGWNSHQHLEICYGTAGFGCVFHPINPRFPLDQIKYVINHAEDKIILFDSDFYNLVSDLKPSCPKVCQWICIDSYLPGFQSYENLLQETPELEEWPVIPETFGATLCFTSGTTGNPKGVLFSNRYTVLYSLMTSLPDSLCFAHTDVIFSVVNFFHVNAWGLIFCAPMVGARLVFYKGNSVLVDKMWSIIQTENVTFSAAVPTFWNLMSQYSKVNEYFPNVLSRVNVAGSTCSPALIEKLKKLNIKVVQSWGMTELTAHGCSTRYHGKSLDECSYFSVRQGNAHFGVDFMLLDYNGKQCTWDGESQGKLFVRGYCVLQKYFKTQSTTIVDGWFDTGDVATIDSVGSMRIEDREKDLIKMGGEWISSVSIENVAMEHPLVQSAACVAISDEVWDEVPVLFVKLSSHVEPAEFQKFLKTKVPRRNMPHKTFFIEEIPTNPTGKIQKQKLRSLAAELSSQSS